MLVFKHDVFLFSAHASPGPPLKPPPGQGATSRSRHVTRVQPITASKAMSSKGVAWFEMPRRPPAGRLTQMLTTLILLLLTPTGPHALKEVMRDPDWIGQPPEEAWWTDDGQAILFRRSRPGGITDEIGRLDVGTGAETVFSEAQRSEVPSAEGVFNQERTQRAWARHGDLYLTDLSTGEITRVTNSEAYESRPRFMNDANSIQFVRDGRFVIRDLSTNKEFEPRGITFQDEEEEDDETLEGLEAQQERLFRTLRERTEKSDQREAWSDALEEADVLRRPKPIRLGKDRQQRMARLSPAGQWLAVTTAPSGRDSSTRDTMPRFVTDSGYVETDRVRPNVGVPKRSAESLVLVDLESGSFHEIDLSILPGITTDPLAWLDEPANENATQEASTPQSGNDKRLRPRSPARRAIHEARVVSRW